LIAVNANTGDFAWQVPLGTVAGLPKDKELQGNATSAGPIATAGGLVFIGAARDSKFRAFDSKTGKELWSDQMEYTATAVPITYEGKNGKQYVAIIEASRAPGVKTGNESLLVYALP
jgi:quinoprotein glucose dehydrogenase